MWDESSLAGVRLLILGGEACPEQLALAARGRPRGVEHLRADRGDRRQHRRPDPARASRSRSAGRSTAGRPPSSTSDGEPVQPGEPGELVIAGVGVARYLDPVLDTERFPPLPALGWERAYAPATSSARPTVGWCSSAAATTRSRSAGGGSSSARSTRSWRLPGVRAAVTVVREADAGNKLLVAYVVGDVNPAEVRAALSERLPQALVPLIVPLDELPLGTSGKVDRRALPWPPPASASRAQAPGSSGTAGWLAERWSEQLGPVALTVDSDFFELGGSSLAAAKLTSTLRERFPAVAVADVYTHRRLGDLAARLDALGAADRTQPSPPRSGRRWGAIRLAGVLVLLALAAPQWLLGILAFNRLARRSARRSDGSG